MFYMNIPIDLPSLKSAAGDMEEDPEAEFKQFLAQPMNEKSHFSKNEEVTAAQQVEQLPPNKVLLPPLRMDGPYWMVDAKRVKRMILQRIKKTKQIAKNPLCLAPLPFKGRKMHESRVKHAKTRERDGKGRFKQKKAVNSTTVSAPDYSFEFDKV